MKIPADQFLFGMDEGDNLLKYMADYLQNVEKEYRYITYGRIEADILRYAFLMKMRKRSQTL